MSYFRLDMHSLPSAEFTYANNPSFQFFAINRDKSLARCVHIMLKDCDIKRNSVGVGFVLSGRDSFCYMPHEVIKVSTFEEDIFVFFSPPDFKPLKGY